MCRLTGIIGYIRIQEKSEDSKSANSDSDHDDSVHDQDDKDSLTEYQVGEDNKISYKLASVSDL